MSSYVIQKMDQHILSTCFDNERNWKRVKPWWFNSPTAESIAWSVWKYTKENGYPPSKSLIPSLIDYKKNNITIKDVENYLRSEPIDSKFMRDLLLTFEANGMLWDIAVKHHDNPIDEGDFVQLGSIADTLKVDHIITIADYQTIIKLYKKWNTNK